jgi:tol-pal system protein YbgF
MKTLVFVAIAAGLAVGCATRGQVRELHREIADVASALGALQTRQAADGDHAQADVKALSARVSTLQAAMSETSAEVAKLASRLEDMERRARETAAAVDTLNGTVARLAAAGPTSPAPTPLRESPPKTPLRESPPKSPPREPPAARTPPAAEQAYASALAMFRAHEHGQAVLDFLDFLARYPKHPLAANAQYWIGEAYYMERDYRQAIVEFEKVLEHGLTNPKVPDALLKIGLSYRSLRDGTRAADTWRRVVRDYPGSEAAQKARGFLSAAASPTGR